MNYQTNTTPTVWCSSSQTGPHTGACKEHCSEIHFGQQVQDHSAVRVGGERKSWVVPEWQLSPPTVSNLKPEGNHAMGRDVWFCPWLFDRH